jgi:lanthanide-dependent methanol dehydrogenase
MRKFFVASVAIAAVCLAALGAWKQGAAQQQVALNQANDWTMPSLNYGNTRNSTLAEITTDNVANLKVAWTMSTGATRGHEGQPLVIGDTMRA